MHDSNNKVIGRKRHVVVIAGSGEPVIGNIPVVTVKKATAADQSGVVGVVDQPLYVPGAATRKAYVDQ
jgi:hypothetical protein